ncbi:hypothetical protein PoB_000245600 [Plakobranchus ocellatus]|uniref:Uncharacterized protein n=1 Tax=Plakobranchus ocellatus TaxID=259542 RepID=A0AAV3XA13_9GAST|nr:hypothetical protein PoB_000245600 [Plakobranchus ocellatus]
MRSAEALLSRVRTPLPIPWPHGGPENIRSSFSGQAIYNPRLAHLCLSPFSFAVCLSASLFLSPFLFFVHLSFALLEALVAHACEPSLTAARIFDLSVAASAYHRRFELRRHESLRSPCCGLDIARPLVVTL